MQHASASLTGEGVFGMMKVKSSLLVCVPRLWSGVHMISNLHFSSTFSSFPLAILFPFLSTQHESGVHRVQRVPVTEGQGRVHTSTTTVAILPQPPEVSWTVCVCEHKHS